MKELLRKHHISFVNAFNGVKYAFTSQPNFRIHFFLGFLALIGIFIFELSYIEAIIIIFTFILGITGEMLNTAIESITDLITTEWRKEAKIAKDVSAGMMLSIAFAAAVIAAIIFLPKIFLFIF